MQAMWTQHLGVGGKNGQAAMVQEQAFEVYGQYRGWQKGWGVQEFAGIWLPWDSWVRDLCLHMCVREGGIFGRRGYI